MVAGERDILINHLDESRRKLEELLPGIDPSKHIYLGWTIKQLLAHITGLDDVCIDGLRAHELVRPTSIPTIHSLDKYNEYTISSRYDLTTRFCKSSVCHARYCVKSLKSCPEKNFLS
jgi:hypothetical protein